MLMLSWNLSSYRMCGSVLSSVHLLSFEDTILFRYRSYGLFGEGATRKRKEMKGLGSLCMLGLQNLYPIWRMSSQGGKKRSTAGDMENDAVSLITTCTTDQLTTTHLLCWLPKRVKTDLSVCMRKGGYHHIYVLHRWLNLSKNLNSEDLMVKFHQYSPALQFAN